MPICQIRDSMHNDDFIENPLRIKETTALQVIVAAVWLWLIPAVNLLNSDTYGGATIALMRCFIAFALGIVLAARLPERIVGKTGTALFWLAVVLLVLTCFTNMNIRQLFHRNALLIKYIGFILLGYGLRARKVSYGPRSFVQGLLWLVLLYVACNLLLFLRLNLDPAMVLVWSQFDFVRLAVEVAIVFVAWKTLSLDSVTRFLEKAPKLFAVAASLVWGMFFLVPVHFYDGQWLMVPMFFLNPLLAFVNTVILWVVGRIVVRFFKKLSSCRYHC